MLAARECPNSQTNSRVQDCSILICVQGLRISRLRLVLCVESELTGARLVWRQVYEQREGLRYDSGTIRTTLKISLIVCPFYTCQIPATPQASASPVDLGSLCISIRLRFRPVLGLRSGAAVSNLAKPDDPNPNPKSKTLSPGPHEGIVRLLREALCFVGSLSVSIPEWPGCT